jgi:hypothetical protein
VRIIFKKNVSITLVLLITCIITLNFAGRASAGDLNSTRQLFDRFEALQGPWNYGYPNDAGGIGWGEACVIRAYLGMYAATGDKAYLDKFVYHADKLLKMRDSDRGVTDYRGLSLPAWRAGDTYTKGKGWYIYGVHTGMTAYPLAEFARVVYSDNSLSAYKVKADTYLQAAKDAVAIHKGDFVSDGDAGYYRETPGSPAEFDGAPVPINQYLAMARAELVLYQVTGDNLYLDHVTRMAKHFKSQLKVDPATGAYTWHYWFGLGESGWSAASKVSVNTPSYGGYIQFEDWSHGVIDVDFAALAYKAGIVFTEDDMKKFGLTAKNMLKPDGSIAVIVNGVGTAAKPELIGQWLRLYQYAPSLAPAVDRIDSSLQAAMPGGFNGIAMLAQAYSGKMDFPVSSTPPPSPPPVQLPQGEIMVNGDFSKGATGWNDAGGSIVTDSNGNQLRRQTSDQNFYQMAQVPAGDYTLNVAIRKGTAASARIIVGFYGSAGKYTIGNDVTYQFKGTGWESVTAIPVKVPAGTVKVRITPFAVSDTNGTVDFDNVSFMAGAQPTNPPPANPVQEIIVNGDFSKGTTGWNNIGGSFKTDRTGNTYRSQTYDQNFYQMINPIQAGQYALNLQTMRGTAAAPARIIAGYYTMSGKYKILSDVTYQHKGSNWESVPEIVFNVPTDAYRLRITPFSVSSSVLVNFDNVSLKIK